MPNPSEMDKPKSGKLPNFLGRLNGLEPYQVIQEISGWCVYESNKHLDEQIVYLKTVGELITLRIQQFSSALNGELVSQGVLKCNPEKIHALHEDMKKHGHECGGEQCEKIIAEEIEKSKSSTRII